MKKALIVYNICGILKDNTETYPIFMDSIRKQYNTFKGNLKVIVSGCMMKPHTIPKLKQQFPEFDYIHVNDKLTVNITFNNAVLKGIEKYGEFDTYAYQAADALLSDNSVEDMTNTMMNNPVIGLYSAQIDQDSCYAYGLKLGGGRHVIDDERARYEMFKDGTDYVVPVGRACAAHFNIYSSELFNFYGRCCPDIFASYCTESVFSFMVAAIKKQWWISKDHIIRHFPSLDSPSAGFKPTDENRTKGFWDHALFDDSLIGIFDNQYARSIGLGFEECQDVVVHDDSQFDSNKFCINEQLKDYIKENLYVSKDKFDYSKINCEFV